VEPGRRQPYRAEGLTIVRPCPEDGTEMTSTGNVFFDPMFGDWYVEYYCPLERDTYVIWSPETQPDVEAAEKVPASED
jgi:hypothetical protein